jgi:hypothetical protein
MNIKKIFIIFSVPFIFLIKNTYAHCPLCTIGAAAAAGGAAYLGVDKTIVGIFIGAFAVSIGWWISRLIKKQYIPFQKWVIIILSFITTVMPLIPIIGKDVYPIYISIIGDYGSLLNRTYLVDQFLAGSLLGGVVVSITPGLSKKITKMRNGKIFPYQGILLTFIILIIISLIIQFLG